MKDSNIFSMLSISAIWGSAIAMMGIAGVFGHGNPIGIAAPPIAAGATTVILAKSSKASQEKKEKTQLAQAESLRMLQTRLETLEAIVTRDEHLLPGRS